MTFFNVVDVEIPTTSTTRSPACVESVDEDVVERVSVTVSESSELMTESVTDTDTTTTKTSLGEILTQHLVNPLYDLFNAR